MSYIEPTYLRYIYDGLAHGKIHSENAAELPYGLIGLYEELFDDCQAVQERQGLLERFAIWALVKKEVSADFVSEVLEQPVEEIREFISTYSSWFNSPENGKYQLYHERLKVYLLQKLSDKEINSQLEKLIVRLEKSIQESKSDEFELYGLEYLSLHLSIVALLGGDGKRLVEFAYNKGNWERQIKISNGYSWIKNGLMAVMTWASKYNDDQLVECGLQMLDVYHKEQNGYTEIVTMVAEGDFEASLKRIDQFGGMDREGLRRKFILYMLCLMEFTLLDSKDKLYRREGILKLIKHLDEQLPVDHSILNWNEIFPSYLMFQMACEWSELGLDYLVVYRRTSYWEVGWISDKGPFTERQVEVLFKSIECFTELYKKSAALKNVYLGLAKQGRVEEAESFIQAAMECASGIKNKENKSSSLASISSELFKDGRFKESSLVMQDALECARAITYERYKNWALTGIFSELAKQGKFEKAIEVARAITDERQKSSSLASISSELFKDGRFKESSLVMQDALECAGAITDERQKSSSLASISSELAKQGKFEKAIEFAGAITDEMSKGRALRDISRELAEQGKFEKAIEVAAAITYEMYKNWALTGISSELAKQGKFEKAIEFARAITDEMSKGSALSGISSELAKQGKFEKAIEFARAITDEWYKGRALVCISKELSKQSNCNKAVGLLLEALDTNSFDCELKCWLLGDISLEMAKIGRIEDSIEAVENIPDTDMRFTALENIALELVMQNRLLETFEVVFLFADDYNRFKDLSRTIANKLSKRELISETYKILEKSIEKVSVGQYHDRRENIYKKISCLLFKEGKLKEALEVVKGITDNQEKASVLKNFSNQLFKGSNYVEAGNLIKDALKVANKICNNHSKSFIFADIAEELAKQGKTSDALKILMVVKEQDIENYISGSVNISARINELGNKIEAYNVLQDSLKVAMNISDILHKSIAFRDISIELANQGRIRESLKVAMNITDEREKYNALSHIALQLAKLGRVDGCMQIIIIVSDFWEESYLVKDISIVLASIGRHDDSLKLARTINDKYHRSLAITGISSELAKQGYKLKASLLLEEAKGLALYIDKVFCKGMSLIKIAHAVSERDEVLETEKILKEALECAFELDDQLDKYRIIKTICLELVNIGSFSLLIKLIKFLPHGDGDLDLHVVSGGGVLKEIAIELAKKGEMSQAERISNEIPLAADWHACWEEIGVNTLKESDWPETLRRCEAIEDKNAHSIFFSAMVRNLERVDRACIKAIMPRILNDLDSLEILFNKYALYELFFCADNKDLITRMNRILDFQWAIDIKKPMIN